MPLHMHGLCLLQSTLTHWENFKITQQDREEKIRAEDIEDKDREDIEDKEDIEDIEDKEDKETEPSALTTHKYQKMTGQGPP